MASQFLRQIRFRKTLGVMSLAAGGAVTYSKADPDNWEKLTRPMIFWRKMAPIYLRYRYVEWSQPDAGKDVWEKMHEVYAPQVLETILQLVSKN